MITRFPIIVLIVTVLFQISGCATDPVRRERYFWPPPPNQPRIEWLGAYHSQLDLERTFSRRMKETLVGEDAPIHLIKPVEARIDDLHNKLYVADIDAGAVFIFDMAESELRMLPLRDAGLAGGIKPVGLAVDHEKKVYVLEPHQRQILIFNSSERFVRMLDIKGISSRPVALAIDTERLRLYVSDAESHKILVLDLDGNLISTIGGPGDAESQLNRPVGLVVNSKGELLVADAFNARIQVFDRQGKFIRFFGTRGTGPGDFQLIKAVAVDPDDNVYVVDGKGNNIKIFNQNGELLLSFGGYYAISGSGKVAPGGFALPIGIDIGKNGRMFVVDQLNARVQVFQYLSPSGTH